MAPILVLRSRPVQSSGGGNVDQSWSAFVTGANKSAATGYIAPVKFVGGGLDQGGRIFPMASAGPVDVYYERLLGTTGSCSITVSTFASTNTTAGTNYATLSSATLTWADGEIGWKKVTINILAIPTGFGLVGITHTGANPYRPTSWIWLRGTGYVPGAKFVTTSNGTNVYGSTSGSGTSGSAWVSLGNAFTQLGNSGGVLYFQNNGTHVEWTGTAGGGHGPNISNQCANTAPLILLPDPANVSTILFDNGSTGGGSSIVYSNALTFHPQGTASSVWLCGMHIYRGDIDFEDAGNCPDWVIWQNEIDNYAISGSNGGGIKHNGSQNIIIQDNYIHEIYSLEGGSSNSYTSVPLAFKEGIITFNSNGDTVAHCTFDLSQYGIFLKQMSGTSTDTGTDVTHCKFLRFQYNLSSGGSPIGYPVQVGPTYNGVVRYSMRDSSAEVNGSLAGGPFMYMEGSDTSTGQYFDMWNCTSIGGSLLQFSAMTNVRVFNCVQQANPNFAALWVQAHPAGSQTSTFEVSDYNYFVGTIPKFTANSIDYTTLANWKAATGNIELANPMDPNSTSTATVPSYANASLLLYQWSNAFGLAGRPAGIGLEKTGIVNNFLNTSLPLQ